MKRLLRLFGLVAMVVLLVSYVVFAFVVLATGFVLTRVGSRVAMPARPHVVAVTTWLRRRATLREALFGRGFVRGMVLVLTTPVAAALVAVALPVIVVGASCAAVEFQWPGGSNDP